METKGVSQLAALLANAKHIACLTGAGMSTESGIPDFRSTQGLYKTLTSEQVFDIKRFKMDPAQFYQVIGPLYCSIVEANPNPGHLALEELESRLHKDVKIATQNIDGLHQKAGSNHVYEVHGTMKTLICKNCGHTENGDAHLDDFKKGAVIKCSCGHVMKPDITFFGESLPHEAVALSIDAFENADLAIVLGTSLVVYPAAALPSYSKAGTPLVIINKTPTDCDGSATLVINDSIGKVLPAAVASL